MKVNKNLFFSLILFIIQYSLLICYFENAPYITDFKSVDLYEQAMKKNEIKYGFMLIYSVYCGHCRHFVPNYIKLSELFHNELFFYALGQNTNYKKIFNDIYGFPTILFFSDKKYEEITFGRSVAKISNFIRKHIPYPCREITYNNIDIVYNDVYQKIDRNIIIGYFKNNSEYINTFSSITNNLKNDYIDLCYYCTDYDLIKNDKDEKYKKLSIYSDISDNEVKSYSKNKGNNTFVFNDNITNYEQFLNDKVINAYEEINNDNAIILERMNKKDFLIFSYNNDEIKQKLIKEINTLYNITNDINHNRHYYILYDIKNKIEYFTSFQNDKIYLVSKNLSNITIINDLNIIKDKISEDYFKIKDNTNDKINIVIDSILDIVDNTDEINKKELKDNITIISLNNEMADIVEEKDNISINGNDSNKNNEKENSKIIANEQGKNKTDINLENNQIIKINIDNIGSKNNSKKEIQLKRDKKDIKKRNKNINRNEANMANNKFYNEGKKEEKEVDEESNKIKYILLTLLIFFIVMYYVFKKILCVGFIKVYDSQIIEFNQSNKLEIV